jgi:hypothetical protein
MLVVMVVVVVVMVGKWQISIARRACSQGGAPTAGGARRISRGEAGARRGAPALPRRVTLRAQGSLHRQPNERRTIGARFIHRQTDSVRICRSALELDINRRKHGITHNNGLVVPLPQVLCHRSFLALLGYVDYLNFFSLPEKLQR